MRKFFLFIVVGILMGVVPFSHAHPLDVSNTTITIYPDSIIGVTYLHPVELDRILVLSG